MKFARFDTALGVGAAVWSDRGLARLVLPERTAARALTRVRETFPHAEEHKPPRAVTALVRSVNRYLDGGPPPAFSGQLDLDRTTPFSRRIYEALRDVPPGVTVSYGELAARAGSPKAARAVGRAMAHNPIPLLIPCHRVIGANGKPVGFTAYGGIATKAKLLALEGVSIETGDDELPFDVESAVRHLRQADSALAALIDRVGPPRLSLERRQSTFAALSEAIVYQQLSGHAAATIHRRVIGLFPQRRALRAEDIAAASEEQLRSAGLSRAKTAALRDLAAKTLAKQIPTRRRLEGMSNEAIVESLTQVYGVGRWTVEMLLIFQLGRSDVLATGDYALRKSCTTLLELPELITPSAFEAHAERWRPFRTLASWYLWRGLEL